MVSGSKSLCMVCIKGNGLTDPEDTCPMFYHQNSMDDDYNAYILKSHKMSVWNRKSKDCRPYMVYIPVKLQDFYL